MGRRGGQQRRDTNNNSSPAAGSSFGKDRPSGIPATHANPSDVEMNDSQMRCDCRNYLVSHTIEGREGQGSLRSFLEISVREGPRRRRLPWPQDRQSRKLFRRTLSHVLGVRMVEVSRRCETPRLLLPPYTCRSKSGSVSDSLPSAFRFAGTPDQRYGRIFAGRRSLHLRAIAGEASGKKWIFCNSRPQMLQQDTEPTADRPPLCFGERSASSTRGISS